MEYLGTNKPVNKIQPLISVCVSTYQHAFYIRECLDSILAQQSDFPFEVIVGEDESTDGTREICMDYAERHPDKMRLILRSRKDVIYINGKPTGRYNFTENMKIARGKYIALCEGDDYWISSEKIQKQVSFLESNSDCTLCFHSSRVTFEGSDRPDRIDGPNIKSEEHKFSPEEVIGGSLGIWTASMVFRAIVVENLPEWYYSVRYGDVALRLIGANLGKAGYIGGKAMSVYRRGSIGAWSSAQRSREWYDEHLNNDLTLLRAFDKYSHFKFAKAVENQVTKKKINYLLGVQNYTSKLNAAKLIGKHLRQLTYFRHRTTALVWLRFFCGKLIYNKIVDFMRPARAKVV